MTRLPHLQKLADELQIPDDIELFRKYFSEDGLFLEDKIFSLKKLIRHYCGKYNYLSKQMIVAVCEISNNKYITEYKQKWNEYLKFFFQGSLMHYKVFDKKNRGITEKIKYLQEKILEVLDELDVRINYLHDLEFMNLKKQGFLGSDYCHDQFYWCIYSNSLVKLT